MTLNRSRDGCTRDRRGSHHRPRRLTFEALEARVALAIDLKPLVIDGPSAAFPGDTITVETKVVNVGDSASGKFSVAYKLSTDKFIDKSDPTLLRVDNLPSIAGPSGLLYNSYRWFQSVPLPKDKTGTFWIAVVVDPDNKIREGNGSPTSPQETNNIGIDADTIAISTEYFTRLVEKPRADSINGSLTSPSPAYMKQILGIPGKLTDDCNYTITNEALKKKIVKKNVGPFSVTGLIPAVDALTRIFAEVKRNDPTLYSQLGTQGMLCIRKVTGGSDYSNHSWGTAIDITLSGKTDARGDNKTQFGLTKLYSYFNREGFYWGAGFPTEDSMHFEVSKELIQRWRDEGKI